LAPLTDDLPLLESGRDSLCLAILVANLDDQPDLGPFGSGVDMEMPATIGDLVRVYENASAALSHYLWELCSRGRACKTIPARREPPSYPEVQYATGFADVVVRLSGYRGNVLIHYL